MGLKNQPNAILLSIFFDIPKNMKSIIEVTLTIVKKITLKAVTSPMEFSVSAVVVQLE